ncbi:MAG: TfoX/Sxy family protein [Proteobacteria bacterium]|nr:TfoX/Sxy family protein [Pseudomonadota bacterium]MBS0571704.1 TfoX/Sxy family protein [Pseudomonadota bacterium]
MARDETLEALVAADLAGLADLRSVRMFGGMAWMWRGNLLCGARADGILLRLGKGNDSGAVTSGQAAPMMMGARRMEGWVRLPPEGARDADLRGRLIAAARAFVETLPPK